MLNRSWIDRLAHCLDLPPGEGLQVTRPTRLGNPWWLRSTNGERPIPRSEGCLNEASVQRQVETWMSDD